jgi:ABC-2 type transport system ATP-binding protein
MSIEVRDLTKLYGEQKAIDAVSFRVGKSEIVGFLGPNGAGKSTTMKIITGYLQPDKGDATVCGISVKDQPLEIKKKIGYLPEGNPLYNDMYVKEYLDFVEDVHRIKNKKQKISEVIGMVGLETESRKKIGQLSKGFKQRVGLAAALIHDPEVLVLDEPTTGLDPNQILEIRDLIKNLGLHKTVLFSSHILQEVEAICDRVLIIDKGRLIIDSQLSNLRSEQTNHIIKVSFKEAIKSEWLENLQGVEAVLKITPYQWEIRSETTEEVKKQFMKLSLQHNLNIFSLQNESHSLEDDYTARTKSDSPG